MKANEAEVEGLSGTERSAVLLMILGESEASEVLTHMNPKEVQSIGSCMSSMSNITRDKVEVVLDEFLTDLKNQTALGIGSNDYVRNVLTKALGEDKAGNIIDRIILGGNSQGLEALKWMEPREVAEVIRLEHPQIIAIVLSYLESSQSAEVIKWLPERVRPDVLMRIATLDGIPPSALKELDIIFEKYLSTEGSMKSANVGGIKSAAEILNLVDSSMESEIIESVKELDQELGDDIEDLMFVFENLVDVDNSAIQALMRDISTDVLVSALKGADETLKDKFLGNMSKRASTLLLEDMEAKGPMKLSDVEAAQKEILGIARQKEQNGEIVLSAGDEFV